MCPAKRWKYVCAVHATIPSQLPIQMCAMRSGCTTGPVYIDAQQRRAFYIDSGLREAQPVASARGHILWLQRIQRCYVSLVSTYIDSMGPFCMDIVCQKSIQIVAEWREAILILTHTPGMGKVVDKFVWRRAHTVGGFGNFRVFILNIVKWANMAAAAAA